MIFFELTIPLVGENPRAWKRYALSCARPGGADVRRRGGPGGAAAAPESGDGVGRPGELLIEIDRHPLVLYHVPECQVPPLPLREDPIDGNGLDQPYPMFSSNARQSRCHWSIRRDQ